jgi:FtsZ-interacting cell division protein ZipA
VQAAGHLCLDEVANTGPRRGRTVDTWVIVLIVVVAVIVIVAVALALSKRSRVAQVRKREQARDHLEEAHLRGVRAEQEQALAEEQTARARRERAEVQERTALAEQEARERAARAGEEQSAADQLRAKAEKLAPDVAADHDLQRRPGDTADPGYPDGGATRR